jgi:hypothetical protein
VQESKPFTLEELNSMVNRVMLEKETQWKFNHPNEPFSGVTADEVIREMSSRVFNNEH